MDVGPLALLLRKDPKPTQARDLWIVAAGRGQVGAAVHEDDVVGPIGLRIDPTGAAFGAEGILALLTLEEELAKIGRYHRGGRDDVDLNGRRTGDDALLAYVPAVL